MTEPAQQRRAERVMQLANVAESLAQRIYDERDAWPADDAATMGRLDELAGLASWLGARLDAIGKASR